MLNKNNTFLINLDKRIDRLEWCKQEFAKINLEFTRFQALKEEDFQPIQNAGPKKDAIVSPGHVACFWSHINVYKLAIEQNLPFIAVFEDDVLFAPYFNEQFLPFMNEVPIDWHLIHLGPMTYDYFIDKSPNHQYLAKLSGTCWGTHAYLISNYLMKQLVNEAEDVYFIDNYLIQHTDAKGIQIYCPKQKLAYQLARDSDICKTKKDLFGMRFMQKILVRDLPKELHGFDPEQLMLDNIDLNPQQS